MRYFLTTIAILVYQILFVQGFRDSIYLKEFKCLLRSTEFLIRQSHYLLDTPSSQKLKTQKVDSFKYYVHEVKSVLKNLDSIHKNPLFMAQFFENGKRASSRELSSPIAQLQCSYLHYMEAIRKAGDNIMIIATASLTLESHLKNGFPSSIYCPFVYDEVKFGDPSPKKIVLPDTLKNYK